jgi:hypothetical protein
MTLQHLLSAIEDPGLPVIWVDDSVPADFWTRLINAVRATGYYILNLEAAGRADSHDQLLACFQVAAGWAAGSCPNLNALKDALLSLEDPPSGGWVILFRDAGFLRQKDEETFEDLLEVVATVHDIKLKKKKLHFKLVVAN